MQFWVHDTVLALLNILWTTFAHRRSFTQIFEKENLNQKIDFKQKGPGTQIYLTEVITVSYTFRWMTMQYQRRSFIHKAKFVPMLNYSSTKPWRYKAALSNAAPAIYFSGALRKHIIWADY
jgi:hypothetical protein